MSKTKGNVVDPWEILNAHGADAMRWYLYSSAPPETSRRFSVNLVGEGVRKYMLTLWNTYAFFVQNANEDRPDLRTEIPLQHRPTIDQWAISRLHETIEQVTAALDLYDPTGSARALEAFVDDLSNWYVRRNRRRFWENDASAYLTLYECLVAVTKLTAPFTPFMAEAMYHKLVRPIDAAAPQSVHLCDYPQAVDGLINRPLLSEMRATVDVVSLGRAARQNAKMKIRQPLLEAVVSSRSRDDMEALMRSEQQLLEELNVKAVRFLEPGSDFITYKLRPNLPAMGKKYGKQVPLIKKALESASGAEVATAVRERRAFPIALSNGESVDIEPDEVLIDPQAPGEYAYAEEHGRLVALNTEVSQDLKREGLARDLVRYFNDLRKTAKLHVADRIEAYVDTASAEVGETVEAFRSTICLEIQADDLHLRPGPPEAAAAEVDIDGDAVRLGLIKLQSRTSR